MKKPSILFAIPDGPLKAHMFTPAWRARLEEMGDVTWNAQGRDWTSAELAERLAGHDALITGWGSPRISGEALDGAKGLCVVAHCAGTVRWLVDESFFARGIVLTNANLALAPSVAEYCLMTALMARWRILKSMDLVRRGGWQDNNAVVPGLNGARIGLIGFGAIAEEFICLLKAFDVTILVCSEHMGADRAKALGVREASFEQAMACDVVSVHKTLTPRTRGLIDGKALGRIPCGGVLINTSRGAVVDQNALAREVSSGRIGAVVDVFDPEPPAPDEALRAMPGVIATPHCAGTSLYWRRKMAEIVMDDVRRALAGETPRGLITLEQYRAMTPV